MAPFWHRWSDFSILNLSVFHLTDKCFAISNLINLRTILFLEYRKTPETLRFRGILRLDTTLSCDNKSIFRLYYSMIVATRPDPTVRPPSRYQTGVLWCASGDFSCDLWRKIRIFHCVRMVFGDFVIMVLSHLAIRKTKYLLSHNFLFSWPFQHIVLIRLFLLF